MIASNTALDVDTHARLCLPNDDRGRNFFEKNRDALLSPSF